MKMKKIITALMLSCFLLSGCAGTEVNFANRETQKVNLNDIDFTKPREITAKAGGFQLFLFIPIGINGRQERAYEKLKEMAGRDYITDIEIKESWGYAFVGNSYKTTLRAKAYPYKK